jgi:isoquinoline 1-oxidoreductase beta subunit
MDKDFTANEISRREFISKTALYTGGLIIAFHIPKIFRPEGAQAAEAITYPPNAFLRIAPDNSITLTINRLEMGQGVNTAFSQLIAEELGCELEQITAVASSADAVYNAPGMPFIITGGSMSVRTSYDQYRRIGAGMREMLVSAAAKHWQVKPEALRVERGYVIRSANEKMSFGELAEAASKLPFPTAPQLKAKKDHHIIGKSVQRLDASAKSTGKAIFGMDVRLPGMLYAMITKPPLEGAKLISIDEAAAKKIPGVVDVVRFADRAAVLAKNTHAAHMGQAALNPKWDNGANSTASTDALMKKFKEQSLQNGVLAETRGKVDDEMQKSAHQMTLDYEFPFLAHAPMEPMNTTIDFDGKTAKLYGGMQMPTNDTAAAAKIFGITPDKVEIHVTYAGGSFGRRGSKNSDYVVEACELAKVVKKPIKIVYAREDDMRGGYYRPLTFHRVRLGTDASNSLKAWDHFIVGQSIMKGSPFESFGIKNGIDDAVVEGVRETKYALENFRVQQTLGETPVTSLWWRSVGNTHTAYVMETVIDEICVMGGHDPLEYRKKMLAKSPKHLAVLELLKKETGWGTKKPPPGRAWGLAIHESFQSVVGQVAEVSMVDGFPKVHRVWAAAHVGVVVNPVGVAQQIEGGIVFGLSAILHQEIELKEGQIVQGNYDQYPVIRMNDTPHVSVRLVDTDEPPTGIGEPGVPPIGPAVANAVYRLTKKRVRVLPFTKGLKA